MFAQLIRKKAKKMPIKWLMWLGNLWLPFLGAGIRIIHASPDYRHIQVQMKLRWYNRNYVGTQFGGSLYSMTDPFYMMMLINNLGQGYIVWDKAACIEFLKPGKSTVTVDFVMPEDLINEIKQKVDQDGKYTIDLPAEIKDEQGELIAKVKKTIYIRRKS